MAEQQDPAGAPRACAQCGTRTHDGQRRCTNCGASVDRRRTLPRRTPLIAALSVAALGGGIAVVAQAAVTDEASRQASAPADPASAPVAVPGNPLPEAERSTSSAPKVASQAQQGTTPGLSIPKLGDDLVKAAEEARNSKDGENTDDDTGADKDDLGEAKKLKIKRARNYDPDARVGVEFGEPKAAFDKRLRTVWDVNVPADGADMGVGIVVDLGETRRASALKIQTPTPGFGAVIYRTDAPKYPKTNQDDKWERVSKLRSVTDGVEVLLDDDAVFTRYVLLFLTTPRSATDTRVAISNLELLP